MQNRKEKNGLLRYITQLIYNYTILFNSFTELLDELLTVIPQISEFIAMTFRVYIRIQNYSIFIQ